MSSSERFTRRYWLRLARFFVIVLLSVSLFLWHAGAWYQGYHYTHPPHNLSPRTPADYRLSYEDVTLTGQDGTRLDAWYIPGSSRAGIVLLHGLSDNRASVLDHADYLHDAGYHLLVLGARAHEASSAQIFPWGGQLPVDDVLAGVDFLDSQPEIETIGVMGFSMGGMQALEAAGQSDAIDAVIADSPVGAVYSDYRHIGGFEILYTLYDAVMFGAADYYTGGAAAEVPVRESIARIAPRPLLLIGGGRAGFLENEADRIEWWYRDSAGENATFWRIPDAGHIQGLDTHPEEYVERVTRFFGAALLEDSTP
jgi:pimeloyl-ACP methyl ester carboxylesterase